MSLIHKNYVEIMYALDRYGFLSARDLSEATGIDHTNIYDYLESLVDVGWVAKEYGSLLDFSNTYKFRLTRDGMAFIDIYNPTDSLVDK